MILLFIPAMQVAVVRFINPPVTRPMLIDQGCAMFSKASKRTLLYRWIKERTRRLSRLEARRHVEPARMQARDPRREHSARHNMGEQGVVEHAPAKLVQIR